MTVAGLNTSLAMTVIDRSYDRQLSITAQEPTHARQIEQFRERVGDLATIEEFVEDYEVYSFVMSAFDLEDQIFGKAMITAILESDPGDEDALINRMTDPRFRELYNEMGFVDGATSNMFDAAWQEAMVDRYIERNFINDQDAQNEDLGAVLEFRLKAPQIDSWYDVTKDEDVARVLRKALGLPDSMAQLELDRQIEIYESKVSLEDFQDPEKLREIEQRFAALADAEAAYAAPTASPIVQLMQINSSFTPVVLDIESILALRS